MFQSAPAITGGRSRASTLTSPGCCLFQSAPAITGGRSWSLVVMGWGAVGFNPRPPSLAGDPFGVWGLARGVKVSIRARHHWRAIHSRPALESAH